MWVQAIWHSPPGHSAPATHRPAGIPSPTIYGLVAYLCQIAERISSHPFDPPDPRGPRHHHLLGDEPRRSARSKAVLDAAQALSM